MRMHGFWRTSHDNFAMYKRLQQLAEVYQFPRLKATREKLAAADSENNPLAMGDLTVHLIK